MTEIPLPDNWSFDVQEFAIWARNNLIGTWDFRATHNIFNPTLLFTDGQDAVAFKLKFL